MADNIFGSNSYSWQSSVKDSCIKFFLVQNKNNQNLFEGLVAQQLQFGVNRQPRIIYEIGSTNYYAIDTRPQGSGTLANIFGPSTKSLDAIRSLGDICNPTEFKIQLNKCNCDAGNNTAPKTLLFKGGFLSGLSISVTAQEPTAQGTWQFIFQDVEIDGAKY